MPPTTARARASRALPPAGMRTGIDAQQKAREAFYRGAAEILAGYPDARELVPAASRGRLATAAAALVLYHGHVLVWAQHRRRWVCTECLHTATAGRRKVFAEATCSRRGANLRATMSGAEAQGHRVLVSFVAGPGTPVCMCTRCGCYAEALAVGIGAPCKGRVPPGGTAYRLGRFLRGKHPTRECSMQGPCRPDCLQAEGEPPLVWQAPEASAREGRAAKRTASSSEHGEPGDRLDGSSAVAARAALEFDDPDGDPFAWDPGQGEAGGADEGFDEPPHWPGEDEPVA